MNRIQKMVKKALWRTSMGLWRILYGKEPMGEAIRINKNTIVHIMQFKDESSQYVIQRYDNLGQFLARYSYGVGPIAKRHDAWVNKTRAIQEFLRLD